MILAMLSHGLKLPLREGPSAFLYTGRLFADGLGVLAGSESKSKNAIR